MAETETEIFLASTTNPRQTALVNKLIMTCTAEVDIRNFIADHGHGDVQHEIQATWQGRSGVIVQAGKNVYFLCKGQQGGILPEGVWLPGFRANLRDKVPAYFLRNLNYTGIDAGYLDKVLASLGTIQYLCSEHQKPADYVTLRQRLKVILTYSQYLQRDAEEYNGMMHARGSTQIDPTFITKHLVQGHPHAPTLDKLAMEMRKLVAEEQAGLTNLDLLTSVHSLACRADLIIRGPRDAY